jgi:hypothetical protein
MITNDKSPNAKHQPVEITQKVINELRSLFEFSPPGRLRQSLTDILLSYLSTTDPEFYEDDIDEIATDFYFLIKFLESVEKDSQKSSNHETEN